MKLKSKDKKKALAIAHNKKQLSKIGKFSTGGDNWTNINNGAGSNNGGVGQWSSGNRETQTPIQNVPTMGQSSISSVPTSQLQFNPNGQASSYGSSFSGNTNVAPAAPADTTTGALSSGVGALNSVLGAIPQKQVNTELTNAKTQKLEKKSQRLGNATSGLSIASSILPAFGPIGAIIGLATGVAAAGTKGGQMAVNKQINTEKTNLMKKDNFFKSEQEAQKNAFDQNVGEDNSLLRNLNNNPVTAQNGLRGMSKYTNGGDGQLEHYNTGLHANMSDSFANAQLDGKPIQLQRQEKLFRKKNGGDYVFTDNLMNPETGNLISKDADKIDKGTQKPFYDEASLKTKNFKMEKLANLNDKIRGSVEQKSEFPMYAENGGSVPKAIRGINGEEIQVNNNGNPLWTSSLNEGPKNYRTASDEEQFNNSIIRATGTPTTKESRAFNPNAYTNAQVDEKLKNTVFAPGKLGPTRSNPPIGYGKDSKNNLTPGDYAQLAGSAVAPIANIANYFRKPEKVKAHLDNTQYSDPRIAKDFNPLYLAENSAAQDIDKGSLSDSVRRAARVSLASGTQRNLQDYSLAVDNQNKMLQMQTDQVKSGTNRFNAGQLTNRDTAQSQTNAVRQNYLNTGLAQAGQSMVDFGKFKNQGKTNEIEYSTLQSLASNYGLDPKEYEDFLKSKGVKITYK